MTPDTYKVNIICNIGTRPVAKTTSVSKCKAMYAAYAATQAYSEKLGGVGHTPVVVARDCSMAMA